MESRGTITNGQYNGVSAVIAYENKQLIFSTKPSWVRIIFGVIGEALVSAKERFRINISDITCLKISETWTGKPVFEITTPNDVCKITFSRDDELTYALKNELKDKVAG
ncbi:MAG: hypothetical protein IJO00_02605 [Clostridia bacterium]|nr:hypothetical protein [Clostridia bacterium]